MGTNVQFCQGGGWGGDFWPALIRFWDGQDGVGPGLKSAHRGGFVGGVVVKGKKRKTPSIFLEKAPSSLRKQG